MPIDPFNIDGQGAVFGGAKGLSGAVLLTGSGGIVTSPNRWMRLLSVNDDVAKPRVLRIDVQRVASTDPQDQKITTVPSTGFNAGLYGTGTDFCVYSLAGAMLVTYGDGAQRSLLCDLQPGDYQLPPCKSVLVQVASYQLAPAGAAGPGPSAAVSGECVDGITTDFRPFTVSGLAQFPAGVVATKSAKVPYGAYAFDVRPGDDSIASIGVGLSTAVKFEAACAGYQYKDFQTGVQIPAVSPVWLEAGGCVSSVLGDTLQVTQKNATIINPTYAQLVFFLR